MSDIVERLRDHERHAVHDHDDDCHAAADEIESLRSRLATCELERDTARELLKDKKARLAEAELNLAEVPTLCRRYEARLAKAEALLTLARNNGIDGAMGREIDAFLSRKADSATHRETDAL